MSQQRAERVAILVHHALATIMQQHKEQPTWQKVNITDVKLSPDLKYAKIFISSLDEKNIKQYIKALNQESKKLRQLLAKSLNLRVTPELKFFFDETLIKGPKLESLIEKAVTEDKKNNQIPVGTGRDLSTDT